MTLYDRLSEEQKQVLLSDEEFSITTRELIESLQSTEFVYELTLCMVVDLNIRLNCGLTINDMYKLFKK